MGNDDTFKEKDLALTALYKDKVLYLQHVYPTMEYCLSFWRLMSTIVVVPHR